jgi:hypothetical protein
MCAALADVERDSKIWSDFLSLSHSQIKLYFYIFCRTRFFAFFMRNKNGVCVCACTHESVSQADFLLRRRRHRSI